MLNVAMLSLHTSPLAQPGTGDGGGMNVYVRELAGSLARAGVGVDVYVRRWHHDLPDVVAVEPGLRVIHIDAGPPGMSKEALVGDAAAVTDAFADGVAAWLRTGDDVAAVHANYWLSGMAGHRLKHDFGLPLVSTFHTLARVKAVAGDPEPRLRSEAEARIVGCSDRLLASCDAEADQLTAYYGADPGRIERVAPGVDQAFFSPGDQRGARAAVGLGDAPVVMFAGRLQPLKQAGVAVAALAAMANADTRLVIVGGASGPGGAREVAGLRQQVADLGLVDRVRFVPPQPHHLLSTWYRAADVVVVPSRSESFGLVALEAAACGIPVVAAAVGGLTTVVDDGTTGVLVDGDDPREWAAHLDALIGNDQRRRDMGRAATRRARRFTWAEAAGRLRRVYADLATRTPVPC